MKSTKVILPVMGFVFAVVTAFASDAFLVNAKGINPDTSQCVTGTLVTPPSGSCNTSNSTSRCQVTISVGGEDEQVPAFTDGGNCASNQALFYN